MIGTKRRLCLGGETLKEGVKHGKSVSWQTREQTTLQFYQTLMEISRSIGLSCGYFIAHSAIHMNDFEGLIAIHRPELARFRRLVFSGVGGVCPPQPRLTGEQPPEHPNSSLTSLLPTSLNSSAVLISPFQSNYLNAIANKGWIASILLFCLSVRTCHVLGRNASNWAIWRKRIRRSRGTPSIPHTGTASRQLSEMQPREGHGPRGFPGPPSHKSGVVMSSMSPSIITTHYFPLSFQSVQHSI
jgi:hypothetical protein